MKGKLMALALLFASLGYINSHATGSGISNDWIAKIFAYITEGASQAWFSSLWHLSNGVQTLLFVLQVAIGFLMVAYFLHCQEKAKALDWE